VTASFTAKDKKLLRDLAKEVKDISADPVWTEKRALWKAKNALGRVRPLVLTSLPDAAWRELLPESSLAAEGEAARMIEWDLRKRIFRRRVIGDDEIIDDKLYVPVERTLTDWVEGRVRPYSARADRAEKFSPVLLARRDLEKMKVPEVNVDRESSNRAFETIAGVFQGILDVVPGEPFYAGTDGAVMGWGNSLVDILCELRGLENVYYDLASEPAFVHDAMRFLAEGTLKYLDTLERENLLRLNNNEFVCASNTPLGSNGLALTDELPAEGSTPGRVRTADLWGYFMAQEFSGVSPDMLEEFVLPYQAMIASRFGMNAYGCCEPNDKKWGRIVARIPNLRELSVSHAADLEIAADALKSDYVFSWKPHPALIASFDEKTVRRELERGLDIAKGCCVVVCLRDTQTLFGEPQRAWKWTAIARELAAEYA
jgi:hypothetical protein